MNLQKHPDGDRSWKKRLPDRLAIFAAACVFLFLATYRIELPGLQYDELCFVDAAQGDPDTGFTVMRLGSLPLLITPYEGALKAWIYAPVFHLLGVSALTVRLPMIVLGAVTLLIFYRAMRGTLGAVWATITVWIMAVDPANIFFSRLEFGPTVLMHFFQAAILAFWFSYRDRPKLWKIGLIVICCVLGFFDKFNFLWQVTAFAGGISLCYPDSVKGLWVSSPKFVRGVAIILVLMALTAALYLILPLLMHFPSAKRPRLSYSWEMLQFTLSGAAVAELVFGSAAGIIGRIPFWLIVADGCLALACLLYPMSNPSARENRRNGFFCLLIGLLIFVQIVITPQANGPHHLSMLSPLPLLTFAFLARSLYDHFGTKKLSQVTFTFAAGAVAICVFLVNVHNTIEYLSHFRSNPHYSSMWSPAIYALSGYINEHGFEWKKTISADWGLNNQLHALAPKKLRRRRIRDFYGAFQELAKLNQEEQRAMLDFIFPRGKSLVITFAASKEIFPETRSNFLASMATHTEFKSRLVKEFWYGGEMIYEVYEVVRLPHGTHRTDQ